MKRLYAIAIGLYVLAYLVPLGLRPLIIPDETRYAEVPREMLASGDWIVPRLNGVRYFEKPVLGYWLNAASIGVFGENRFAVRLPCALSAGLTALLLFGLVRRYGKDGTSAVLSAGILLGTAFFYGVGTFAVLDMPLTLFLTGAMVCFFFAYRHQGRQRRFYEALFGAFCGLAFLTKGFLAFAVPVVVIVPFMFWEKRWRELFTMAWVPIAAAVLISLPWGIAIHAHEPDFWRFFFWHEHVKRFLSDDAQHAEAIWFFLPVVLGGLLPWTLVLPAGVAGLKQRGFRHDTLLRYCVCWFLFPFLFFSMSRGKLPPYILPCFPPLAFLMASGLQAYFGEKRRKLFDVGAYVGAAIFALAVLVVVVHEVAGLELLPLYGAGETYKLVLAGVGLLAWAAALLAAGRSHGDGRKLLLFALGPVVFMIASGLVFPNEAKDRKAPEEFLARHADAVTPETIIVVDPRLVRAVCWLWKRDDVFVIVGLGELKYGLEQPDATGRFLSLEQLADMLGRSGLNGHVVLVAKAKHFREWESVLPQPTRLDIAQGFAFAEFGQQGNERRQDAAGAAVHRPPAGGTQTASP